MKGCNRSVSATRLTMSLQFMKICTLLLLRAIDIVVKVVDNVYWTKDQAAR